MGSLKRWRLLRLRKRGLRSVSGLRCCAASLDASYRRLLSQCGTITSACCSRPPQVQL